MLNEHLYIPIFDFIAEHDFLLISLFIIVIILKIKSPKLKRKIDTLLGPFPTCGNYYVAICFQKRDIGVERTLRGLDKCLKLFRTKNRGQFWNRRDENPYQRNFNLMSKMFSKPFTLPTKTTGTYKVTFFA